MVSKNVLSKALVLIFILCSLSNSTLAKQPEPKQAQENKVSLSQQKTQPDTRYPDYSMTFSGKDTCESFNRKIFIFNQKLNKFVIRPVNKVWASVMPKYGMDRIQNACNNLEYPKRFTSCLLQGDVKASGKETLRFLTNTTIGLGGLYDPAKKFFNMEPKNEDTEQVLAKYKIKKGPYIVLPIITPTNTRGVVGKILDCPLDPSLYVIGPITMIVKAGLTLNKTTYLQSLAKTIEDTYADPYDITKKLYGIDNYIKNSNLDRKEVIAQLISEQQAYASEHEGFLLDSPTKQHPEDRQHITEVKPDINLEGYSPQGPVADSMRTALFEVPDLDNSIWSEMSIWNRCFSNKIKTSSVNLASSRPDYKFRYIMQKNKNAPVAIVYPSIGEGIMSHHSVVLAKIFYDEGYSVIIQGSCFQWEFVKSAPENYRPGLPSRDAEQLRIATGKIVDKLQNKYSCKFDKKILIGTSFGALTSLFVASKEENQNTLDISKYISINPPIEILYALKQLDKNCEEWNKNQDDLCTRAAVAAGKIIQVSKELEETDNEAKLEVLPFSEDEAKLIVGFIMRQKLSDVIFTIENASRARKSDIYAFINNTSYQDYAQKYLMGDEYKTFDKLSYDTSLYSISSFLRNSNKYKIYHTLDDYFVNKQQLSWLKKVADNKTVYLSNGSHLGFLYRPEFQHSFKQDIMLSNLSASADDKTQRQLVAK